MAEFVKVADLTDVPAGSARCIKVNGKAIALCNVEGAIYATDDTCTHADASLCEGTLDGHELVCPLHFAAFDVRTGACTAPPAYEELATYEVRVNGKTIELKL
ncbi:MAG: non-heme iron oxygenase ferredoxin subunit [Planctomycetes bacterium]|nr:non-heme iron oxygenase ferredoxin subunit [Planctomycetota bacterium]